MDVPALMRALPLLVLVAACGPELSTPQSDTGPGRFSTSLTTDVLSWRAVLPNSYPGTGGHSGQRVRVLFNAVAAPTYDATQGPVRFAEGSLIAKAVVATNDTPLAEATRLYFMRKEAAGYDPASNDWSWAIANRSGSTWTFSLQGRSTLCTGCHQADAAWDFARSVQIFRTQTPP